MDLAPLHLNPRVSSESRQATELWLVRWGGAAAFGSGVLHHRWSRTWTAAQPWQTVDLHQSTCRVRLLSNESPARLPALLPEVLRGRHASILADTMMHKIIEHNNKSNFFCYKAVLLWNLLFCIDFVLSSFIYAVQVFALLNTAHERSDEISMT